MVTREAIVAAARSWLGTPYHHQASVKGVGSIKYSAFGSLPAFMRRSCGLH
jgi:hypothetical protein